MSWPLSVTAFALAVITGSAFAQSSLENPAVASFQSGVGIISGWACQSTVRVLIDGRPYPVGYGTPRADVAATCGGNANVGFGLLLNYNTLGAGAHVAQLQVNGTNVGASAPFSVSVPAGEFPLGLSGAFDLPNFPANGQTATVRWQQSLQNFAIVEVKGTPSGSGFPITFKGIRIDAVTQTDGSPPAGRCVVTATFANTDTVSHSPFLSFDVIQSGIYTSTVAITKTGLPGGATGQASSAVLVNSNYLPCGSFTTAFNATASFISSP